MPQPPPDGKHYRIRLLKRGDRDAVFRLLAEDGWAVPAGDQELAISWVVQHPEMESFVAHDATTYARLFGMITMSHRPQLRLGGRVASIDMFVVTEDQRGKGIGHDLFALSLRRAEALGCKRIELHLGTANEPHRKFFEDQGFKQSSDALLVRLLKGRI